MAKRKSAAKAQIMSMSDEEYKRAFYRLQDVRLQRVTNLKREAELLARDVMRVERLEQKPHGKLLEILKWAKRNNVDRASRLSRELKQFYDDKSRERESAQAKRMTAAQRIVARWPRWNADGKSWKERAAEMDMPRTSFESLCRRKLKKLKYRPAK